MTSYLRLLIAFQVAAAGIALVAAIAVFPVRPEIGGPLGVTFWIAVTLVASALPISLPAGITVSVGSAPLLASMILGGPAAAGLVGALGTFDVREIQRQIPWYGTLSNHAQIAGPAAIAGILYEAGLHLGEEIHVPVGLSSVLAAAAAGAAYNALNNFLAALIVSERSGQTLATVWAKDLRIVASNVLALVPLAWLMAQIYLLPNGMGWWATLLFVVPLFTSRLAYHRYVETREMFEQTIGALANA